MCPECGETKARANTMDYHFQRNHTKERRYACTAEGCDKKFIQKSELTQHERHVHSTDETPKMQCPFCEHSCTTKGNMITHIGRIHGKGWVTEIKGSVGPFTCTECKKELNSSTTYFNHAVRCYTPPPEIAERLVECGYLSKTT